MKRLLLFLLLAPALHAQFPWATTNAWNGFEGLSNGVAPTNPTLVAGQHGDAGSWDPSLENSLILGATAGQAPFSAFGDTGVMGMSYNLANGGVGYAEWNLPSASSHVSAGVYYCTGGGFAANQEGPHFFTWFNFGTGNLWRASDERSSATNVRQIRLSPGNNAVPVADDTCYWITMQYNAGGTVALGVYTPTMSLVGTATDTDTVGATVQAILLGNSSATTGVAGQTTYFDDLVVNYTGSTPPYPLLVNPPPSTWYIRTDGGTSTQCTGKTNAAYPGSGSGQACGLSHPFYLLNQSTGAWNISMGDTIQFEDTGPYYMGNGPLNGLGQAWPWCGSGTNPNCYLPTSMPDNISWLGLNHGSCNPQTNATKLLSINAQFWSLNIQGTHGADVECLEFSQPDACTRASQMSATIKNTSSTGGIATYGWQNNFQANPPEATLRVNVVGTTNGSGAFNGTAIVVAGKSFSTLTITGTQMTTGVATYTFNPASLVGYALRSGDIVNVTGTTNGGGIFNTGGGDTGGTTIANVTGTTFQITFGGSTTIAFQSESGSVADLESGFFTANFSGGNFSNASESGTLTWTGNCVDGVNNYGQNGLVFAYSAGTQGPINATVKDIYAHGMAVHGMLGSKFNTSSSDTFTASNWYLDGNGATNYDGDNGECTTDCESIGTMNFTNITSIWSGCIQVSPGVENYCVDQAFNGNGDNLVMVATGGTWNWNHVTTKWGMQDCFDSLHTGDDPSNLPTLHAEFLYSEGCEGQAIKMSGGDYSIINSVGISNCKVMLTASNFPSNLPGWNAFLGSPCRALDSMAFTASDGHTATIQYVTNIGEQVTGWDIVNIGPTGCSSNTTCIMKFENNTTLGFPTGDGSNMSGIDVSDDVTVNPFNTPGSIISNNNWFNVNHGCPSLPSNEVNPNCSDPLFVAESNVNAIDPHLTSSSPLIASGINIPGVTVDFAGNARPNPPAIGAFEFGTTPPASFSTIIRSGTVRGNAVMR